MDEELVEALARRIAHQDGVSDEQWWQMDAVTPLHRPWVGRRADYAERARDLLRIPLLHARLAEAARVEQDIWNMAGEIERLHETADRLSYAVAPVSVLGEHSSMNDPWQNALNYLDEHPTQSHRDPAAVGSQT